nr:PREDICTED: myelin and lymphocyte protein-like isoform X1 [Equus przewalskii]
MWRQRLPSGREVFTTFPDVLFIFELVFGGLVWILIASSLVPLPLLQGWVMFASVFCFVGTTALFFWYIIGVRDSKTSWKLLDIFYHFIAALFYLSASLLEGSVASTMEYDLLYEHYLENVFAAVSSPVNLLVLTAPTTH